VLRQPDQETLQLCRVAEISASLLNDRAAERRLFTVSLPSHAMVSVLVHAILGIRPPTKKGEARNPRIAWTRRP
jgi:hypothetical protein